MAYVYNMQNLSFGSDGALAPACRARHAAAPWLCFMSPHMVEFVTTPLFLFNSKYDKWQLQNIYQSGWATAAQQRGVLDFGEDFVAALASAFRDTGRDHRRPQRVRSPGAAPCPAPRRAGRHGSVSPAMDG